MHGNEFLAGYSAKLVEYGLAVAYLLVGLVVIFIRGILAERVTAALWKEQPVPEAEGEVASAVAN